MNVVVSLEYHFARTPDGAIWTQAQFPYAFWTRYLEVFDQVRVVARVSEAAAAEAGWQRADGAAVSFAHVPDYLGPRQYLARARQIRRATRQAPGPDDAVILRVASQLGAHIQADLQRMQRPYAVEVVSDPYDVFAPSAVKHPLRPLFRWWFPRQLRRQIAHACAAAYVTTFALQRRYPPAPDAFSTAYSSIELPKTALAAIPRPLRAGNRAFIVIYVGTMGQLYKAPDVVLDALAACIQNGLALRLMMVGDGQYRAALEARATKLGIGAHVHFYGQLGTAAEVYAMLDQADLFVLPSRQEGLPRAMIEAMARALPCIGSTVGGIPELLPAEDLVPPNDVGALARTMRQMLSDPQRMAQASARNLAKAQEYNEDLLRERRITFYRYVRERTDMWLRTRRRIPETIATLH